MTFVRQLSNLNSAEWNAEFATIGYESIPENVDLVNSTVFKVKAFSKNLLKQFAVNVMTLSFFIQK